MLYLECFRCCSAVNSRTGSLAWCSKHFLFCHIAFAKQAIYAEQSTTACAVGAYPLLSRLT